MTLWLRRVCSRVDQIAEAAYHSAMITLNRLTAASLHALLNSKACGRVHVCPPAAHT